MAFTLPRGFANIETEIARMEARVEAMRIADWRPAPHEDALRCRLATCRRHGRCHGTARRDLCPLPDPHPDLLP